MQSWLSTLKPQDETQIRNFLRNEGYDLTETFDALASLSDTKLEKWLDGSGLNFRVQGILMKQIKDNRLETGYNNNNNSNNNGNKNENVLSNIIVGHGGVLREGARVNYNYNEDAVPAYGEA